MHFNGSRLWLAVVALTGNPLNARSGQGQTKEAPRRIQF
jgi:hypothetical protein